MKQFAFSLEKVLNLHEKLLLELMYELRIIKDEITFIEHEINTLKEEQIKVQFELNAKASNSLPISMFVLYKNKIYFIIDKIKERELELITVLEKESNKKDEILEKHKEILTYKKLKEKESDNYQYLVRREEQKELEYILIGKIKRDY